MAEASEAFSPVGAGIVLAPNGVRLLEALGVNVLGAGEPLSAMTVVDVRGRRLQEMELGRVEALWGPTYALARAALSEALVAALPSGVELCLGQPFVSLDEGANEVEVTFGRHSRRVDLVVAAA